MPPFVVGACKVEVLAHTPGAHTSGALPEHAGGSRRTHLCLLQQPECLLHRLLSLLNSSTLGGQERLSLGEWEGVWGGQRGQWGRQQCGNKGT